MWIYRFNFGAFPDTAGAPFKATCSGETGYWGGGWGGSSPSSLAGEEGVSLRNSRVETGLLSLDTS